MGIGTLLNMTVGLGTVSVPTNKRAHGVIECVTNVRQNNALGVSHYFPLILFFKVSFREVLQAAAVAAVICRAIACPYGD